MNKTASPTRTQLRDVARSASDEAIPRAHLHTEHGGLLRFARNILKVLNCQSYNFLCIEIKEVESSAPLQRPRTGRELMPTQAIQDPLETENLLDYLRPEACLGSNA